MTLATRTLIVTQGNLNNNHLYLTEVMDLFPRDVIGGANRTCAAPRTVRVLWGGTPVDTDIVGDKHIFRRRGWVVQFFAAQRIAAGDVVLLEQLGPYQYRVARPPGPSAAQQVLADLDKDQAFVCRACGRAGQGPGHEVPTRGPTWLNEPVRICGGCFARLGSGPQSAAHLEAVLAFWFRCLG